MMVDFYGKTIDEYERTNLKPYVGFISPNGKLVDFNNDLKENHINYNNIIGMTFLLWLKDSKQFENLGLGKVPMKSTIDKDTGIVNCDYLHSTHNSNIQLLQNDLIDFLRIMDSSPQLAQRIMDRINVDKIPEYIVKAQRIPEELKGSAPEIELLYGTDNVRNLLYLLKDIIIEYLRYDTIAKVKPGGRYLGFEDFYKQHPEEDAYIYRPRTITTTYSEYHERYYYYLLMDWIIEPTQRYIFNPQTNQFVLESMGVYFLESDTDRVYAKEIEAIKRLIPLKDRIQFIR